MRERLIELLTPVVRAQGVELWELEYSPRRGNALLRIYIDAEQGIDVDDCARVSHAVSAALDEADPIPIEYTLEVSSPGMDRVLRTAAHFERFVGDKAQVDMVVPVNGRRKFLGKILSVSGDDLVLDQDGMPVTLSIAGVSKARLAPWS